LVTFLLVAITIMLFVAAMSRSIGAPAEWSDDMTQLPFVWLCM
jgi:TRAP-type C4-dicarboxylate transport system permease small subunit